MNKTWEDRPLSKSKVALVEMQRQLEIISKDVEQASTKNQLDLLQKIDITEDLLNQSIELELLKHAMNIYIELLRNILILALIQETMQEI